MSNGVLKLKEAREHTKRYREISYNRKLLMWSELDVLINKLYSHHQDLDILIKSGVLREFRNSIMVSTLGNKSNVDQYVAFFVKDLLTRL